MFSRSDRLLWICVAASLALHAVILTGLSGVTTRSEPPPPPLTARLVAIEPPPPPRPKPPAKPRPAAKKAATSPKPQPAPVRPAQVPTPSPIVVPEAPVTEQIDPYATAAEAAEPAPAAPEPKLDAAPEPQPEPAPVVSAAPSDTTPELPQTGSISYDVYFGSDKFSIGRSIQTWSIDKASYRLTSFSETTGLVGLFRPYQYAYVSEGSIDDSGLHPRSFTARRGPGGEQQSEARFDWSSNVLTLGPAGAPHKVPLQPGTLDLLSFIYQLARTDLSPGRLQLVITTGTKVDTYLLDVGPQETLELPMGRLRTIPVRQVRAPGEESIEIWLAPEQRFLPVRIRFLDREGNMAVEQLANRIAADGS